MKEFAIKVQDVWKTFDSKNFVLRGVNLSVVPGELILIRGRSGSGKSTLLSLMGCIDVPSKGDIYLNGYDTAKLSEKELAHIRLHKVGIVFQSHNLLNDLTVFENVLLPLRIAGKKDYDKVRDILSTFELTGIADNRPNEISGGERQRVAIARALMNNPSVLLADEPTASLDIDNCDIVMDAFRKANREFGTTVLIASHDPVVDNWVQRRYILSRGIVREDKE